MKVEESCDKGHCNNCDSYDYVFDIETKDGSVELTLCKKCLLELLKAIIER